MTHLLACLPQSMFRFWLFFPWAGPWKLILLRCSRTFPNLGKPVSFLGNAFLDCLHSSPPTNWILHVRQYQPIVLTPGFSTRCLPLPTQCVGVVGLAFQWSLCPCAEIFVLLWMVERTTATQNVCAMAFVLWCLPVLFFRLSLTLSIIPGLSMCTDSCLTSSLCLFQRSCFFQSLHPAPVLS